MRGGVVKFIVKDLRRELARLRTRTAGTFWLVITVLQKKNSLCLLSGCYMTPSIVRQGVWFPQWAEVLARLRCSVSQRRAHQRAIGEYLRFCKQSRQRATLESARQFMQHVEAQRRLGASQL